MRGDLHPRDGGYREEAKKGSLTLSLLFLDVAGDVGVLDA